MFVRESKVELPQIFAILKFSLKPRKEILSFLCEVPMSTSDSELSIGNSVKQLRLNPALLDLIVKIKNRKLENAFDIIHMGACRC